MVSYEHSPEYDPSRDPASYIELRGESTEFIGSIDTSVHPDDEAEIATVIAGTTRYDVVQYPGEQLLYLYVPAKDEGLPILHPIAKGSSQIIGRNASVGNPDDGTQSRLHCEIEYSADGFVHIRNHSAVNTTGIILRNITQVDFALPNEPTTQEIPVIPEKAALLRSEAAGFSMVPENYRRNRSGSDDRMLVDNSLQLYGVFDGIGSKPQAGRSAQFIAESIQETFEEYDDETAWLSPTEKLVSALECANREIVTRLALTDLELDPQDRHLVQEIVADGPDAIAANVRLIDNIVFSQAGSTACLAQITERYDGTPVVAWASVGDSRLYLIRDNKLVQITQDETHEHYGNIINNWVGRLDEDFTVRQYGEEVCFTGDTFVLVTDGVTGDNPEQAIDEEDFIKTATISNPDSAAWKLTRIATKQDDRTAVVIHIK